MVRPGGELVKVAVGTNVSVLHDSSASLSLCRMARATR